MWTLSGFADEIDKDFTTQCEVVTGLGLKYIEIRSAWGTNILDLDADQLDEVQQIPGRARSAGLQHRLADRQDQDRRRLRPHLERMRHAAEVARLLRRAVHPDLLVLHPRGRRPGRPPRRGDHPDAGDRRRGRAGRGDRCCTRTRRRSTATSRAAAWTSSTSVDSPNLKLAWDPANYVQVRGASRSPRATPTCGRTPSTSRSRTPCSPTPRWWSPGRATARCPRPSARCATTASTASSPSSRTSVRRHALGGFSGPELFTGAGTAFTDILTQRRDRVRMSSAQQNPRRRVALVGAGRHRPPSRPGDHPAGRPARAGRGGRPARRAGAAARRRSRRTAVRALWPRRSPGPTSTSWWSAPRPAPTARSPSRRCRPAST